MAALPHMAVCEGVLGSLPLLGQFAAGFLGERSGAESLTADPLIQIQPELYCRSLLKLSIIAMLQGEPGYACTTLTRAVEESESRCPDVYIQATAYLIQCRHMQFKWSAADSYVSGVELDDIFDLVTEMQRLQACSQSANRAMRNREMMKAPTSPLPLLEDLQEATSHYRDSNFLYGATQYTRGQAAVQLRLGYLATLGTFRSSSTTSTAYEITLAHANRAKHLYSQAGDIAGVQVATAHSCLCRVGMAQFPEDSDTAKAIGQYGKEKGSYSLAFGLGLFFAKYARRWLVFLGDYEKALAAHKLAAAVFESRAEVIIYAYSISDQLSVHELLGDQAMIYITAEKASDVSHEIEQERPRTSQISQTALNHAVHILGKIFQRANKRDDPERLAHIADRLHCHERRKTGRYGGTSGKTVDVSKRDFKAAAAHTRAYKDQLVAAEEHESVGMNQETEGFLRRKKWQEKTRLLNLFARVRLYGDARSILEELELEWGPDWWNQYEYPVWENLDIIAQVSEGLGYLYVQLSRCLDGITLLCKALERYIVGNTVSKEMAQAEQMPEHLSEETIGWNHGTGRKKFKLKGKRKEETEAKKGKALGCTSQIGTDGVSLASEDCTLWCPLFLEPTATIPLFAKTQKKATIMSPMAMRGTRIENMVNPYDADWKVLLEARVFVARPACIADMGYEEHHDALTSVNNLA
ncbi:hypothetical protein B0J13DRAFT_531222 [Dactylonectria estremocensis]|uniref:Uncharacterized protein n=1 Tax=Dactylonectria estremocensis TaxID=1079267 RepID=A0A9P9DQP3_9HYPO|nr:hypothetical protein B0J13DRAFT_531222 [Dactylonectria estremocensis]